MTKHRAESLRRPRIAFVAFQMVRSNPSGSTLIDLALALSRSAEITVYSSAIAPELAPIVKYRRIPAPSRGGLIGQLLGYYFMQALVLLWDRLRGHWSYDVVHGNDSEVFGADYLTFHNCHADCLTITFRDHLWEPLTSLKAGASNVALFINFSLRSLIERRNVARARRIYVLTERQRELATARYGAEDAKILVRPNYIQDHITLRIQHTADDRPSLRRRYGLSEGDLAAVFVAQGGWRRKGLDLLFEAAAALRDSPLRLLVVGAGGRAERSRYHRLAERLDLGTMVSWLGHQADVVPAMRAADIFVLPSFYEAFSLVSLEALAVGLPLIMTDVSGAKEVISDGVNGFVVEPTPQAIAAALRTLMADESRRQLFGEQSKVRSAEFTRERRVRELVADYFPEPPAEAKPAKVSAVPI